MLFRLLTNDLGKIFREKVSQTIQKALLRNVALEDVFEILCFFLIRKKWGSGQSEVFVNCLQPEQHGVKPCCLFAFS